METSTVPVAHTEHAIPTVFVVDDDLSIRESLGLLIRNEGWKPELFSCAKEFLNHPRNTVPQCLLLDVSLPDTNGLELQKQLAVDRKEMPIIFITRCKSVPVTVQAMKAGAFEFLIKPFRADVLLPAIQEALKRSRAVISHETVMQRLRANYASLTYRERQVMGLIVSGLLNKQVGGKLGISEVTVKAHRGSMMRKMMAESLPDLVRMAAQLRIPGNDFVDSHLQASFITLQC